MRKFVLVLGLALFLSGCVFTAQSVLTAVEIGSRVANAVHSARSAHPGDLSRRLELYANLYCDLRVDYSLEWTDVRQAALDKGAPDFVVDEVKARIDEKCGEA